MADRKTTKPLARATANRAVTDINEVRSKQAMEWVRRNGGSKEDQEDVAQSVVLKMFARRKSEPIAKPGGYVHNAARNTFTDIYNERQSDEGGQDELSLLYPTAAPSAEEICMNRDLLSKAMDRLSEEELEAVTLIRGQGLSYEEAAKAMNTTSRHLRTVIARALKRCQEFGETTGEST